jgi:hypothetical protein
MTQKVGQGRGASIAGTGRRANQNWYGMAHRLPFMACPEAPKVAKSKLRFPFATGVIVLATQRYLGYIERRFVQSLQGAIVDPGKCPEFYCLTQGVRSSAIQTEG